MKAKTYIAEYDYYILFVYMLLMFIGLYMQLNISSIRTSMSFFYRQFIWFGLSIFSLWFAFKVVKLEKIRPYIFMFLIITILLLIAVLIFGENVKGAIRSFRIWKINIQPSLIARIVLILYFAHFIPYFSMVIVIRGAPGAVLSIAFVTSFDGPLSLPLKS